MHEIILHKAINRGIPGCLILCGLLGLSSTIQATTPAQSSNTIASYPSEDDQKQVYKASKQTSLPPGQLLIPANRHCLYTTIIIGYLLPVRQENDRLTGRIARLFGHPPAYYLNQLYETLQNPTHYLTYLRSHAYNTLITFFMTRMEIKKGTWGGPQDIQPIANKLIINIQGHYPDPTNSTRLVQSDLTTPAQVYSDSTIDIVQDRVHPAEVLTEAERALVKDSPRYQHYRLKYTLPPSIQVPTFSSTAPPMPHQIRSSQKSCIQHHLVRWFKAAETGDSKLLAALYHNHPINVNTSNEHDYTALMYSAQNGQLNCLKYLVEAGADINTSDKDGDTALLLSAEQGHLACVKYLVQQGTDIHASDKNGNTPLLLSAWEGHLACLKYLVQRGADIHASSNDGHTALLRSAQEGQFNCVKLLVQQGVDINAKNKWKNTALILSARRGHLACLKWLIQQGADIHIRDTWGNQALLYSAWEGHLDCLTYLYQQGTGIHNKNKNGNSALILSAQEGHLHCVKYLVQEGANVMLQGEANKTALAWANEKGHQTVVDYLSHLTKKAQFEQAALQKWFESAKAGNSKLLAELYNSCNLNVDIRNKNSDTALLWSASNGHLACLKWLLQQGANIHDKNKWGNTPLLLSAQQGYLHCVKWLLQQGANIHDRNRWNNTALILSAYNGHLACVILLIQQGADMTLQGQDKKNALQWAKTERQEDVIHYLFNLTVHSPLAMQSDDENAAPIVQKYGTEKPKIVPSTHISFGLNDSDTMDID